MCRCCCYGHRRPTGRPVHAHGNEPNNQTKPRRAPKETNASPLCRSITLPAACCTALHCTATVPACFGGRQAARTRYPTAAYVCVRAVQGIIDHSVESPINQGLLSAKGWTWTALRSLNHKQKSPHFLRFHSKDAAVLATIHLPSRKEGGRKKKRPERQGGTDESAGPCLFTCTASRA